MIMTQVCAHLRTVKRESDCRGFCKLLGLPRVSHSKAENIPPETRHLMSRVILAFLGSHEPEQPESRQLRIVKNTPAPIINDGFIGVCCKSFMKLCSDIKLNMLWCDEKLG
jgi:hypothetical protein